MGLLPAAVIQALGLPVPSQILDVLGLPAPMLGKRPTSVQTSEGTIINIITTGSFKRARASTGQETEAEPISTDADQNIKLIDRLAFEYSLGAVTKILAEEETSSSSAVPKSSQAAERAAEENVPYDQRFLYTVTSSGSVIMSLQANVEKELVDGFLVPDNGKIKLASSADTPTNKFSAFYGVPAIMNVNAYINLQAAGGKGNNKFLIDRENQPRFYDANSPNKSEDNLGPSKTPTTTNIINWSNLEANSHKFPYRYQDFVYCKWWQKIPNNYMITLRRYPFPVGDAVTTPQEAKKEIKPENLYPVATMITYLGEDAGNKISDIVGKIDTGLKWKDIKADVWTVTSSSQAASVNNPAPAMAKALGFLQKGAAGSKNKAAGETPVDPYESGPYINKILGPVNVIMETKARDRGLVFKHEIKVTFEYSLRSIGGINTKAAALDILSNALVVTSASASFWEGMNRHAPHTSGGDLDPFLGGEAGRKAWIEGNPMKFYDAVKNQFSAILENVGDFFNKITQDPVGGLKDLAMKGASEFMKLNTSDAKGQLSGLHSLLTGLPVGEWHLQVGSPFNPIMMIGNLICTGATIDFNDELGPDDFPTELKVTVTLEHGMPRDRDSIESMFNAGAGRIYALPKGYEDSMYSSKQSNVDPSTAKFTPDPIGKTKGSGAAVSSTQAGRGGQGSRRALVKGSISERTQRPSVVGADVAYEQMYSDLKLSTKPEVRSKHVALYSMGVNVPGVTDKK